MSCIRKRIPIVGSLAIALAVSVGCSDFNGTGFVRIFNDTDQPITVTFDGESQVFEDDPLFVEDTVTIEPGEDVYISTEAIHQNGTIWVVYEGKGRPYDLDFDMLGSAGDVHIVAEDFGALKPHLKTTCWPRR